MKVTALIVIKMKNIICYLSIVLISFSCQERETDCKTVQEKYDSVININNKILNSTTYKFINILQREQKTYVDSLLIDEYKLLLNEDKLVDFYIWDRIKTINQNINKYDVYKNFKGTYLLKQNYNKKYAQTTKVIINNDSCYLYKYNDLLIKDKFELINSSDEFIKGKINLKRYKISLIDFSSKTIIVDDNLCVDCEQLQFFKTN
jgi:RecG-like helicase